MPDKNTYLVHALCLWQAVSQVLRDLELRNKRLRLHCRHARWHVRPHRLSVRCRVTCPVAGTCCLCLVSICEADRSHVCMHLVGSPSASRLIVREGHGGLAAILPRRSFIVLCKAHSVTEVHKRGCADSAQSLICGRYSEAQRDAAKAMQLACAPLQLQG